MKNKIEFQKGYEIIEQPLTKEQSITHNFCSKCKYGIKRILDNNCCCVYNTIVYNKKKLQNKKWGDIVGKKICYIKKKGEEK